MSIFLFLEKETEQKAKIMCVHNFPDMLSKEERQNGVLVDSYIEPTPQKDKSALPYWNYETQEVFFEFVDVKKEETELQQKLEEQEKTIAKLSALVATLGV